VGFAGFAQATKRRHSAGSNSPGAFLCRLCYSPASLPATAGKTGTANADRQPRRRFA
jgi:hypothetical protein